MENQFFIDLTHIDREWAQISSLKPFFLHFQAHFQEGSIFVHLNDFYNSALDKSQENCIKNYFLEENKKWGIIFITGGSPEYCDAQSEEIFSEFFDNGTNQFHLFACPVPTDASKEQLTKLFSRYLDNDDPFHFELLDQNCGDDDLYIAFRVLFDCSLLLLQPDSSYFKKIPEQIKSAAKRRCKAALSEKYWRPVKSLIEDENLAADSAAQAMAVDGAHANTFLECIRHIRDKIKMNEYFPDMNNQFVLDYLEKGFQS